MVNHCDHLSLISDQSQSSRLIEAFTNASSLKGSGEKTTKKNETPPLVGLVTSESRATWQEVKPISQCSYREKFHPDQERKKHPGFFLPPTLQCLATDFTGTGQKPGGKIVCSATEHCDSFYISLLNHVRKQKVTLNGNNS